MGVALRSLTRSAGASNKRKMWLAKEQPKQSEMNNKVRGGMQTTAFKRKTEGNRRSSRQQGNVSNEMKKSMKKSHRQSSLCEPPPK